MSSFFVIEPFLSFGSFESTAQRRWERGEFAELPRFASWFLQ
jgi:hypothetical protein